MSGSIYIPRTAAVSDIIDTDDAIPTGAGADTTQFVVDLLGDPDRNKPLGEGFQNVYPSEIDFEGTKVKKFIDAEEYLKQQGYRHVYFAYDPGEVARDLTKENIALLKTQMAAVIFKGESSYDERWFALQTLHAFVYDLISTFSKFNDNFDGGRFMEATQVARYKLELEREQATKIATGI